MIRILTEVSQYLIILFIACYTWLSFRYYKRKDNDKTHTVGWMTIALFATHFLAFLTGYLITGNENLVLLYGGELIYFILTISLVSIAYPDSSKILTRHVCMLLNIGFIMLVRLSYTRALRQFVFAFFGTLVAGCIPFIMKKMKELRKAAWIYGIVGVVLLVIVWFLADSSYGAKMFLYVFGISIQPSEFIKITYVFFLAAMFEHCNDIKQVLKTGIIAALHVLVLVASKDLGAAFIYSMVYVIVVYVSTKKSIYLFGGLIFGSAASWAAYQVFDHVKTRVTAWIDPWSVINDKGYQVAQSLFAIGTGGWFGMGLFQGSPNQIPVVEQDFMFSAIAEELGGISAICIILICLGCLLLFLNIAMQIKSNFYRYMALGLSCVYGIQVFLTIGGAIKLIPSTGVTLPLVSYGGSSLFSTLAIFFIVQGLYILKEDEGAQHGKDKRKD